MSVNWNLWAFPAAVFGVLALAADRTPRPAEPPGATTAAAEPAAGTNGLDQPTPDSGLRFSWVDVYLESGTVPLAAYQLELAAKSGEFQIVGIEGGEHPAFAEPPYYDPAALAHDRVILGVFSMDDELPTGRTRVARVHVSFEDQPPEYSATLIAAADADGSRIPVIVETKGDES